MLTDGVRTRMVAMTTTLVGTTQINDTDGVTSSDRMCFSGCSDVIDDLAPTSPASAAARHSSSITTSETSNAVNFASVQFAVPLTALVVFNLVVIGGNSLVVAAVFTHRKLRTVTNVFIVSLATSDLLLGLLVLPSSSAYELLGRWPFGRVWCHAWLAIDVWLCTASILNLVAISLDRYLAISRPFRYPTLMSPSRARVAIAVVWTLAIAICIPPLLGWRDVERPVGGGGGGGGGSPSPLPTGSGAALIVAGSRPESLRFEDFDDRTTSSGFLRSPDEIYDSTSDTGALDDLPVDAMLDFLRRSRRDSDVLTSQRTESLTVANQPISLSVRLSKSANNEQPVGFLTTSREYTTVPAATSNLRRRGSKRRPVRTTSATLISRTAVSDDSTTERHLSQYVTPTHDVEGEASQGSPQTTASDAASLPSRNVAEFRPYATTNVTTSSTLLPHEDANSAPHIDSVVSTEMTSTAATPAFADENAACALTSEPGYIIYSASGSFWIPMLVMVFFYVRIYRTATRATDALRRGVVTTKTGGSTRLPSSSSSADGTVNLRVHRGGGGGGAGVGRSDSGAWTSMSSLRYSNGGSHDPGATATCGDGAGTLSRNASHAGQSAHDAGRQNGRGHNIGAAEVAPPPSPGCPETNANAPDHHNRHRQQRQPPRIVFADELCNIPTGNGSSASHVVCNDSGRRRCERRSASPDCCCERKRCANADDGGAASNSHRFYKRQSSEKASGGILSSTQRISVVGVESTAPSGTLGVKRASRLLRRAIRIKTTPPSSTAAEDHCDDDEDFFDDDSTGNAKSSAASRGAGRNGGIEHLLRSALTPVYEHCPAVGVGLGRGSSGAAGNGPSASRRGGGGGGGGGLLNIKTQLRRLNREKKAAKTVGIIVGCFSVCWTPFFVIYILGAFCSGDACSPPPVVFTVFFWLGYCNSAVNPFIYALCSNDFRDAFRRLLRCGRTGNAAALGRGRRGAAMGLRRRIAGPRGEHGLAALVLELGHHHQQSWDCRRNDHCVASE